MLELARAVDLGGLINALVNPCDKGDVHDRPIPCGFPQLNKYEQIRPVFRLRIPIDLRQAKRRKNRVVNEPAVRVQKRKNEIRKDDHRDQVRQHEARMKDLGKSFAEQLRHEDGDNDRHNRPQYDKGGIIQQRVSRHDPGIARLKQKLEIVESDPIAAEYAFGIVNIFKGNKDADHRNITVYNKIQQSGSGQEQERKRLFRPFRFCPRGCHIDILLHYAKWIRTGSTSQNT
ncbi:hypothetical protein D3C77_444960 [compost metagenome]